MRKALRADRLIPFIFGLLLAGEGTHLSFNRAELGIPEERLGPDVYLILLGILIVCCVLGEVLTAGSSSEERGRLGKKQREVALILGLFVAYLILLPYLGFTFSTAFFLFSFTLLIPRYRWEWALAMAAIVTVSYYLIFAEIGQVVLPRGIIGF